MRNEIQKFKINIYKKKKNVTKTVQGYSQKWITNTICNPLRSFIHFTQIVSICLNGFHI